MHYPTDRIIHTATFVTPVVEHLHFTMKDRSDDPSHHEQMLLPQCYISLRSVTANKLGGGGIVCL